MGQGQKFNTPDRLSNKFDAVSAKGNSFSDIVKAANNFLLLHFVSSESSPEEQRIAEANIGFSDSISTSVIPTVNAPNEDERTLQKKRDEESERDALLAEVQKQLEEANKRISKMIDECQKMAEWCRDQAKKASEAMDKITERMTKNNEIISDFDEEIGSYKATGHFDREKVRKRLAERGIKTKDDISDKKLIELAEKARLDLLQDNSDQSKLHDELKKVKEDWEAQQKLAEQKKREWEEEQKRLNGGNLPPEEKTKQLEELKKNAEDEIEKMRQKNAATQESQQQSEKKVQKSLKNSESKASSTDFLGALEESEAERGSLGKQFVSVANPAIEKSDANNIGQENKDNIELAKLGKVSGPGSNS